jgi:hypothetical protein
MPNDDQTKLLPDAWKRIERPTCLAILLLMAFLLFWKLGPLPAIVFFSSIGLSYLTITVFSTRGLPLVITCAFIISLGTFVFFFGGPQLLVLMIAAGLLLAFLKYIFRKS